MGTFRIVPDQLSITSGGASEQDIPGGAFVAATIAAFLVPRGTYPMTYVGTSDGINTPSQVNKTTFGLSLTGNIITLDGVGPAINFFGLPAGFSILSATVSVMLSNNFFVQFPSHYSLWFGSLQSGNFSLTNLISYVHPAPLPSVLNFFLDGVAFQVDNTIAGQQAVPSVSELQITGIYEIVASPTIFPMALPTISAAPTIRVGDDVTINDPTGNLHDVTDVFLTFEDGTTLDIPWSWIWVWTNYTITFTIPFEVGSYVGIIYISIISVHFGGSVLLGTLQVQYENATGIYKLDPNISNDVRYIRRYDNTPLSLRFLEDEEIQEYYFLRAPGITPLVIIPEPIGYMEAYIEDLSNEDIIPYSTLSVTVEQIKIPNPFASTAFIGG